MAFLPRFTQLLAFLLQSSAYIPEAKTPPRPTTFRAPKPRGWWAEPRLNALRLTVFGPSIFRAPSSRATRFFRSVERPRHSNFNCSPVRFRDRSVIRLLHEDRPHRAFSAGRRLRASPQVSLLGDRGWRASQRCAVCRFQPQSGNAAR
jgi:hypothetical protein